MSHSPVRPGLSDDEWARVGSLYQNALYLWVSWAVLSGFGFLFWLVAAREVSADAVGLGSATISAINLLVTLSTFGLGFSLVRMLADVPDQARVINTSLTIVIAASTFFGVAFVLGAPLWFTPLAHVPDRAVFSLLIVLGVVLQAGQYVMHQTFIGSRTSVFALAQSGMTSVLSLVLLLALAPRVPGLGVMLAFSLSRIPGFLFSIGILPSRVKGYRPCIATDRRYLRQVSKFSFGNYLGDLASAAGSVALPILVVGFRGSRPGAYFFTSLAIVQALIQTSAILALLAVAEGASDQRRARTYLAYSLGGVLVLGGLETAALIVWGRQVLGLLFGREYMPDGYQLLRILALAVVPAALVNIYVGMERLKRRSAGIVAIQAVSGGLALIGSWALIPGMGGMGGAVAFVVANGIAALVAVCYLIQGWQRLPALMKRASALDA